LEKDRQLLPHRIRFGGAAMKIKITTVGNAAGVVLPKALRARLRLGKGDKRTAAVCCETFVELNR
jgi:hypothetical protein